MKKLIVLFMLLAFAISAEAQLNRDSLWGIWNNEEAPDSIRLFAIKDLIQQAYLFSNPDTAFHIAQSMYDFAEKEGYPKWKDTARNYQGISHAIRGNHNESITYFNECLEISEELGNQHRIAGSLNNIGLLYKEIEDYEHAVQYLNRALVKYEAIADTNGLALTLGNLSMLQDKRGVLDTALIMAERSLVYFKATKDKKGIANTYSSIGSTHGAMGDRAKEDNELVKARFHHQEALKFYQLALPLREEAGDLDGIAVTLHGMGRIYGQLGNPDKGIELISQSLSIAEKVNSPSGIRSAAGDLSGMYKAKGLYQKALRMNEYYHATNDSIMSQENQRSIIRQEYNYAYEKQALADSLAERERTLELEISYQSELRRKDRIRNLFLSFGLLALLVALGLWSRNRYIKSANLKLAIARDRAEQSEKYKEQFLANMSHEIRTPMHAISGMVKILKRNQHPASQNEFLNAMQVSSDNLVIILNDVLDLSKIEAGKLDIEAIPFKPSTVMDNVHQIMKFKAEEKGLNLNFEMMEGVPDLVLGDPTRLNQILVNLTGNAIKFTEKGSVDILLSKENDHLKFSIKDTGIGIPKDKLDSIFAAFEQAKDSTNRLYGGTGLGLSITKQLVELQKGKIWAESEVGRGSTFCVQLPIIKASSDDIGQDLITEDRLKAMAEKLKGIQILLAEDNPFNQMIAQDDLSFYIQDIKIDTVENGVLAVEKFNAENYDLILMDVQMPEMNGFEATRKIREIEITEGREKAIPIIAMTASLLKSEIDQCFEAGMDSYIPKPYKPEELIAPIYTELKLNQD